LNDPNAFSKVNKPTHAKVKKAIVQPGISIVLYGSELY
jgi:hypothetical protein